LAPDVRLAQVDGIGRDGDLREDVAVPYPVLDHRESIACGYSCPPEVAGFDVSRGDCQGVAVPHAGRETHERVRRVIRRMLTTVHPDGPLLLIRSQVHPDRK